MSFSTPKFLGIQWNYDKRAVFYSIAVFVLMIEIMGRFN